MITKSATDTLAYVNNLLFTVNARAAWEHILLSMKNANCSLNVLMPSYIGHTDREGSGVFDPLVAQHARAEFYKVNDNLSINIQHFESLIITKKFTAILVIHYFGFCRNDMDYIKKLCQRHEVLLIEDCAHAFQIHERKAKLGNYGDFSFYSLHKYLPTNSGGILRNNSGKVVNSTLPLSKRINQTDLEQYANSDFSAIAEKRRANYERYQNLLSLVKELEILYQLEDGDIPQTFAVRIKNGLREKLYFYLMDQEAPTTALYYRMISEIPVHTFPLSHKIADEILNLPVHQDTENSDVDKICTLIKEFYSKNV